MRGLGAPLAAVALAGVLGTSCSASSGPPHPTANPSSGGTGTNTNGTGGSPPSRAGAGPLTDAGVVAPPTTTIDPVDYTSSCETEQCAPNEKCLDCTFGTCCGKNCGQQLPCAENEVTYCDRQGGAIACGPL